MSKKVWLWAILSLLIGNIARAQTVAISGTVKSQEGDLLHLAFVQEKQGKSGVYTDSLGNFALTVRSDATLHVTCLGYKDTLFKISGNNTGFLIVLKPAVNITAANNQPGADAGTQQLSKQALSDRILFNTPVSGTTNATPNSRTAGPTPNLTVKTPATGPIGKATLTSTTPGFGTNGFYDGMAAVMGTTAPSPQGNSAITQGDAIAVFSEKGETQGSRFYFKDWAHGYVINSDDSLLQNPRFLLNYDKIGGSLLLTKDRVSAISIYNDKIKSFTLFDETNQPHTFIIEPDINKSHYVEILSDGSNYKIYKSIKTTFVKANYVSDGVASTGNNFDEYHDDYDYYILNVKTNAVQKITLKKKAIKEAFAADSDKLNKFMADNSGDIDDSYLASLGDFMNK